MRAERETAASLRLSSEDLHRKADAAEDQGARDCLRLQAVEVWAAADAMVPEERV